MTTTTVMPEQGQLSPACNQHCHQKPLQDLSVWHYRRSGIYYLRVRPRGCSTRSITLSLRSTDRPTAMQFSKDILKTLAVFHLDRPEAAWEDLKERIKDIAEEALTMGHSEDSRSLYMGLYEEMSTHLAEAASTGRLNVAQQRGVSMAGKVLRAAQERLEGRPEGLVGIVEDLACSTPVALSPSLSVNASNEPLTFETLSGLSTAERKGNVTTSTLNSITSNCRTLSGLLGDLDLRTHTRADMVALKEKAVAGRKPLTVNKLLTQLTTVMDWAKNNGYIERSFDKGLKIERGADSTRRPFSRDEVATISREYVENIMLPMLVAQCATVQSRKFEIVNLRSLDGSGTVATEPGAIAYAMWVSTNFYLMVVDAFVAMRNHAIGESRRKDALLDANMPKASALDMKARGAGLTWTEACRVAGIQQPRLAQDALVVTGAFVYPLDNFGSRVGSPRPRKQGFEVGAFVTTSSDFGNREGWRVKTRGLDWLRSKAEEINLNVAEEKARKDKAKRAAQASRIDRWGRVIKPIKQ